MLYDDRVKTAGAVGAVLILSPRPHQSPMTRIETDSSLTSWRRQSSIAIFERVSIETASVVVVVPGPVFHAYAHEPVGVKISVVSPLSRSIAQTMLSPLTHQSPYTPWMTTGRSCSNRSPLRSQRSCHPLRTQSRSSSRR